jgi:hypothetical protein
MLEEVRQGTGPLWVVEGLTRSHALAGVGRAAVSYAGCYSWQSGGEALPCWEHVNLQGRLVYDVPDADARTNESVQKAQARRVAYLESRGARVLVVSVPEIGGDEHAGLDDFIAGGGDLEELARAARPFVPVDVGPERLRKDERLRLGVAKVRRSAGALETRTRRECSGYALACYLVRQAERHGKPTEGGIQVRASLRQMASGVRVALPTVSKALEHLESESVGFLKAVRGERGAREAASYLLLYPSPPGSELSEHIEGDGVAGKESQEHKRVRETPETPLCERDSFLSVHLTRGGVKSRPGEKLPGSRPPELPALRNSKLVHEYERKGTRRVVVASHYYPRYGKKPEAIIRYVLEAGRVHERELHEKFGAQTSRLRDFRRTWLEKKMLKDGVFIRDGGWVLPAPDWLEALEGVRERTDEKEDNRRQDAKYAEQGRTFRLRLAGEESGAIPKPERVPELAGRERTAEIVAAAKERDQADRVEEQRRKVGMTAEVFLADALQDASGFGWRELRALWIAKGGKTEDLRRAVKDPYQFRREGGDTGALYVERTGSAPETEHELAPVAILREKKPTATVAVDSENLIKPETESPPAEDWRSHPLDCECVDCMSPMPTYARAWSGSTSMKTLSISKPRSSIASSIWIASSSARLTLKWWIGSKSSSHASP